MNGLRYAWIIAVLSLCAIVATPARAEITTTGDTKDDGSAFYAGYHANTTGALTIDAGSVFNRGGSSLGNASGSTGTAIITGAGSKWTNSVNLYVGGFGSGSLTVSDGGLVSARTLYASLSDLHGDGTISVRGAVLDADLSLGATQGLTRTLAFGSGGTIQFTMDGTSPLGVGYKRSGSLRIAEGCSVVSADGYLGYFSGSSGVAIVTGAGSKWTDSGALGVGVIGSGTLRVEAGGQVSSAWGYLGANSGSSGVAIITGAGSKWANSSLYVGSSGSGSLTISDGAQVTAMALYINSQSTLRLHVSDGRMLLLGDVSTAGSINSSGKLSLLADAFLPSGTYRPIAEYADRTMSWSGSGSTLAVGGTWDSTAQTFTVLAPTAVDAGTPAEASSGMRLLITDPASGERAGISFGTLTSPASLTSSPLPQAEQAGLLPLLASDATILSAWRFAGQLAGDEALLSFDIGLGEENLRVWRLTSTGWTEYTPDMLTYDSNGIVSFTIDPASLNSSAYAITVPEPAGLSLLAFATLLIRRRARTRVNLGI